MPRGASRTAEMVCFFRALERTRPPLTRIVDDPYARLLLPRGLSMLAGSPAVRRLVEASGQAGLGGLHHYVTARHRVMDDAVMTFAAAGGTQVVILGAGLDTRAWRLGAQLPTLGFFEVDFPATQAEKRARLPRVSATGTAPAFVPVDFERDDALSALVRAGLDVSRPVLHIWEGVTMYLSHGAIRQTLQALARMSPLGSEVIFDAWTRPGGDPSAWLRRAAGSALGLVGEPLRGALTRDEGQRLLAETGWAAARWLDADALGAAVGVGRGRIYPDVALFHARRHAAHRGTDREEARGG